MIAFEWAKGDPKLPYGQFALASPSVLSRRAWPTFAVRAATKNGRDSGWRIHSSKRPRGNVKLRRVAVGPLLDRYACLDTILDEPTGSAWLWNARTLDYERVVLGEPG